MCAVQVLKYGVVRTQSLCTDLRHWRQLYLAGRLQKPVLHLRRYAAVDDALAANLDAALRLALLLLPHRFSTQQLLEALCGISYTSDVRMAFAEDAHKVWCEALNEPEPYGRSRTQGAA